MGFVLDAETGQGIKNAVISVDGNAKDMRTDKFGDYWRLLVPGTYSLSVHAQGFVLVYQIDSYLAYFFLLVSTVTLRTII